jgi:hypothetical protein
LERKFVMRASYLARGLIGILVMAAPVAPLAGGEVELREIGYETWIKPEFGDRLPVGGPVIRVYSIPMSRSGFWACSPEAVGRLTRSALSCSRLRDRRSRYRTPTVKERGSVVQV